MLHAWRNVQFQLLGNSERRICAQDFEGSLCVCFNTMVSECMIFGIFGIVSIGPTSLLINVELYAGPFTVSLVGHSTGTDLGENLLQILSSNVLF